jgi:putative DNA primase/helicase
VRAYVQRAMGYTLSGRVTEKAIFFLLGPRDTGKTIFIETMLSVFGSYGLTAADGLLRKKREGTISNDVNDLKGFRLAITSETEPNMMLDETLIKALAGGDTLRNRALYRGNEQWKPQCGLWLASNHHPLITGDDDAIWGRIKVVNFNVQFSRDPRAERRVDPFLPDVLAKERSGILNWLLAGYAQWAERGLDEPTAISVDSAMYQREQDTVVQWLEDYKDQGWFFEADYARLEIGVAFRHYERWCRENGYERSMLGKKRLGQRLRSHYGEPQKGHRWEWHGVGIREGSGCPVILLR